ncbi:MAG TPA: ABC transporter substrate-binding protein [Methylomirabilota bacterium]|nr:ABC transporter substrate-binding protein [Methylomirabilota bacterium]
MLFDYDSRVVLSRVDRRAFIGTLAGGLLAAPLVAVAQQTTRVARVGWLGWVGGAGQPPPEVPLAAFRSGLRDLGWVEGKTLVIEMRSGGREESRALTAELVRLKVDVLVGHGPMVFGAKAQAGALPVVFGINGDPVEAKLVSSIARPGGNVTGITAQALELAGKRLDLLRQTRPGMARVAVVANEAHPGVQAELRESRVAAQRLGLALQYVPVRAVQDFGSAFDSIAREAAEGLSALPDTLISHEAKAIAEFAAKRRIPTISGWAEFAQAGNLISYGPNLRDFYRHIAVYVDKILKGAKPAELPVEYPTTFELIINLKTAKALGLTIPPSILERADQVIE